MQNKRDAEAYERLLADEALRTAFKERLSLYARTLAIALSSVRFLEETPGDKIDRYKDDLKFFMQLHAAVRRRYAEVVDFKEYEGKIQKLIDTHVGTGEVERITDLVNIFDSEAFASEVEKLGNTASGADHMKCYTFGKQFSPLLKPIESVPRLRYRARKVAALTGLYVGRRLLRDAAGI